LKGELTYSPKTSQIEQSISAYQPSEEIKELYRTVRYAFQVGNEVINRPFEEFNNKSLIERLNEDQRAWLSWSSGPFSDPDSDWRWTGVRPITRNKILSTAAHLTAQLIQPSVFAQNDQDEEDRDASHVISSLLEYNIQRSDYELAFLYGVISSLVNPVAYFKVEYTEAMQDILVGKPKKFKKEPVLDDELSGFQFHILPPDEILFPNPYQYHFQRQDFIIHHRKIAYEEAEALHGEHEDWEHVKRGTQYVISTDALFYDVEDVEGNSLVNEVRYYHRRSDTEIVFVNGVYLSNKNTNFNPFKHRTNKNKPKYPVVKFGAEPIDAMRFFGYKSLVMKMSNDQELYDRMWQMAMDGTFLTTFPPVFTIGAGKIDKSVIVPGTVSDIQRDAQVQPITAFANPASSFNALREIEASLSESSQDIQLQGKGGQIPQTARQSLLIQQNAETNLSLITRMIGTAVKEVGELMIDDILRFQTVGEVNEILAGVPKMKFRTFIVGGKTVEGKNITEYLRFTDKFMGKKMSQREIELEEMRLFDEAGEDKIIFEINPNMFAKLDFLVNIDYEQMLKKNTSFERAFKLEVYDRLITNPFVDQVAVTRDFLLEPLVKGEAQKYITKGTMEGIIPERSEPASKGRLTGRMIESAALEKTSI